MSVAVLGLGGIGGMLVARTGALGIGTERSVAAIRAGGLTLVHGGETTVAHPEVATRLHRPVGVAEQRRLALGREHFVLAPEDLARLWTRRTIYLWNNYKSLPVLEAGMTGSAVRWVQARLAELGFLAPGDPSGDYDIPTIDAVREFQRTRALDVTGGVDATTLIALYQALDYDTPRLSGPSAGGES